MAGPWMAKGVRHNAFKRLGLSTGLSLTYEYVVEPANHQTNAGRWQDVGQRLVGTLAAEAVFALGRQCAKAFR